MQLVDGQGFTPLCPPCHFTSFDGPAGFGNISIDVFTASEFAVSVSVASLVLLYLANHSSAFEW